MRPVGIVRSRAERRQLERENARQSSVLREVPRSEWPIVGPPALLRVWRSRDFFVQEHAVPAPSVLARLTVNRTELAGSRWRDGITWEELQRIKAECGYADADAVEVYPAQRDIVDEANMRHLWIMREPLEFAWRMEHATEGVLEVAR